MRGSFHVGRLDLLQEHRNRVAPRSSRRRRRRRRRGRRRGRRRVRIFSLTRARVPTRRARGGGRDGERRQGRRAQNEPRGLRGRRGGETPGSVWRRPRRRSRFTSQGDVRPRRGDFGALRRRRDARRLPSARRGPGGGVPRTPRAPRGGGAAHREPAAARSADGGGGGHCRRTRRRRRVFPSPTRRRGEARRSRLRDRSETAIRDDVSDVHRRGGGKGRAGARLRRFQRFRRFRASRVRRFRA